MTHGTHCHCTICIVGKKMGMIRDEQHDDHDNPNHEICEPCNHAHKEGGHCDRGCK